MNPMKTKRETRVVLKIHRRTTYNERTPIVAVSPIKWISTRSSDQPYRRENEQRGREATRISIRNTARAVFLLDSEKFTRYTAGPFWPCRGDWLNWHWYVEAGAEKIVRPFEESQKAIIKEVLQGKLKSYTVPFLFPVRWRDLRVRPAGSCLVEPLSVTRATRTKTLSSYRRPDKAEYLYDYFGLLHSPGC